MDNKDKDYKKLLFKEIGEGNLFNTGIADYKFLIENVTVTEKNKLINSVDNICKHEFNLLGSGKVEVSYKLKPKGIENYFYNINSVSDEELRIIEEIIKNKVSFLINNWKNKSSLSFKYEPIDWHVDFKSGYRWDKKTWYKKIKYGRDLGADIKVPWELSRFYHLVTLGQAYFLTGNEKYASEFIYQTVDWIENNPPQFGVNWLCTMDVAIRAANWFLGLSFFRNSELITDGFLFYFIKNIYIHGKHIINNLEYGSITTNHYLSDISGLLFISELFNRFDVGKKWKKFAISELKKEMAKQVYDDGVDFEASTCYHRLVLELFFYSTLFTIKNSSEFKKNNFVEVGENIFGKEYIKKLYKMFEFVLYVLKPDGRIPQIGDNDNGRFFIFCNREILDMRYLLSLGAIFFKEAKFKVKEFGFCEEALWVFGKEGYDIWNSLEGISIRIIDSRSFPNAGFYILRKDKSYMIVSCGSNDKNGSRGHSHNDKLSFELSVDDKDILVDPGTYVYTPIPYWRNEFRSTFFHNTVVIDGAEQNRFSDESFFLENDAKCKVNMWKTTEKYDFLDAEHYGYRRLKNQVIHRRQILYDKNECYWIVRDLLTGKGEHKLEWCFHMANNLIFNIDENHLIVNINISANNKENVELKIIPLALNSVQFFKHNSWLSYSYGEKVSSIIMGYSKTTEVPSNFTFVITTKKFDYSKDDVINLLERYSK